MIKEVDDLEADMFTFCEHNLQINRKTSEMCREATKSALPNQTSKVILADNPIQTASNFKPGGTGQVITNHLLGRIATVSKDKIGRWTKTTFHGHDTPVTIYTAYAPTASIPSTAKATNTLQQRVHFEQQALANQDLKTFQSINNQTPRKQFEIELINDIKTEQTKGNDILLLGDLNDTINHNKSFVMQLMQKCQLIDIWSKEHPDVAEPATYFRGRRRIDHCLATVKIAQAVEHIQYTPFFTIAGSDHAGIILDLNTDKLFPKRSNIQMFQNRGLYSNDYRQLPKYIKKVYDHLDSNNIFESMRQLQKEEFLNVTAIEKIDKTITQAAFSGEKSIKRRRKPWWSIEMHVTRYTLNITNKAIHQLKKGKFNRHQLQLQLDQHQCSTELPPTMAELIQLRTKLRQDIRDISLKSREKREEFLQEHATSSTTQNQDKQAKIIAAINHTEKVNKAFKTMSSIRKPSQQNGVTTIQIPASWGTAQEAISNPADLENPATTSTWKEITDLSDIQQYMLARNRKHFNQAYGTPLTLSPWPDLLDWAGSSSTAQEILEGRYSNEQLPEIQAAIFRHCKKIFENPIVHRELTVHDMKGKLKKWRETTSTSPSGRHLGHYRAMVQSLAFIPDPDDREKLEEYQNQILELYTAVVNYATKFGYILERWKTIESTMIPKDIGNTKIHRLRVIHIFEADYNLLLGVKWRELIWGLENKGGLHPGQHGSRPGHQATDLTLLEELTFDVSKCSRTAIGNFDNDASACYDRVIAEFASLAALSHGHHPSLVKANTEALKKFKYYIRNTTNTPTAFYQHDPSFPIYGTGQGCANSPTVWCLVSSTLFKAHQQVAHGAQFLSPDRSLHVSFSMVGFVDDSTGRVNEFEKRPQPNAAQLTQLMSEDAQHWNDALEFSGGKLELPKCSYHLLSYQFNNNGQAIPVEKPNLPDLYVKDKTNPVQIKRMSVFQNHKTLGHWKAPCSKGATNLSKLQDKATKISQQINSSQLTRTFIWLMYMSVYVAAIKYTLPQNFYPANTLEEAQRQSMRTLIGACGFSRNTPLAVLYSPTHLGGAGFIKWFTLQGEGQIISFIQHWRTQTEVGLMLRITLFWAQHFAGTSTLILNDHSTNLDYVPSKWMMSLRNFLATINGQLHIYQPLIYPSQRHHDQLIMDIAHHSQKFTSHQLAAINICRLYLQVSAISDITTEDGIYLQSGAYHGPPSQLYSTPKWLYPLQNKPHYKVWRYWLLFLDLIARPNRKLQAPLGPWLHPASELARNWNEYRNKHGSRHYVQQITNKSQWLQFDRHRKTWTATCIVTQLPLVDLFPCQQCMPILPSLSLYPPPSPNAEPSTFQEFLDQQAEQTRQFLAHVDLHFDPYTILEQLQNDSINYLVTDGASVPLRTAYGWVLATEDETILAEGHGPGAGASTSYRAEAYGLHAGLRVLRLLCEFTQQSFLELTVMCDNKSIITKSRSRQQYHTPFPTSTTMAEWDQLENAHQLTLQMNLDMEYQHVKGHQDAHTDDLDFAAHLNIRADYLAGVHINHQITPRPHVPIDEVTQCHLQIDNHTVTSNHRQAIRDAASAPALRQYILSFCSPLATQAIIDWNVYSTVNQRLKHLRVWSTKFLFNVLPTVTYEKTYTYDRPRCSTCPQCVDTWIHLLSCPNAQRRQISQQHLQDTKKYLQSLDTSPDLLQIILLGLRTFYLQQDPAFGRHHALFLSQEKIGWVNFIKGLWHKDWCLAQDQYLREIHRYSVHSTGTLWAIKVITYFREYLHNRWVEHTHSVHNPANSMTATRKRLLDRIQYLQTQYSQCCPHHSHQFFIDTHDSHHSITSLQNWLHLHASIIDSALLLHRRNALLSQSLITTYFSTPP